jgi:hypothetical protein
MLFISASLGVGCAQCHVQGAWEKDDQPAKNSALRMLAMVRDTRREFTETMTGSIIQQGTEGSSATITLGTAELAQIRSLLAEIRDSVQSLDLSRDQAAELRADVASIDAQLQSPKPKFTVIREALSSIRAIMEGGFVDDGRLLSASAPKTTLTVPLRPTAPCR